MKPLLVIDLDVVTVYLWDKSSQAQEAAEFIAKLEGKNFGVIVPYTLLELAEKWKYAELREKILAFYKEYAREISAEEVMEKLESFRVNDKEFALTLVAHGVKEEDAALVMIASLFAADYLVTFNRKHLRSKERQINGVLKSFSLQEIKIRAPGEVLNGVQNV